MQGKPALCLVDQQGFGRNTMTLQNSAGKQVSVLPVSLSQMTHTLTSEGWEIAEKFDDRFTTEVGGFDVTVKMRVDEHGRAQGEWVRDDSTQHVLRQRRSAIYDSQRFGRWYTVEQAGDIPDCSAVLLRVKEREAIFTGLPKSIPYAQLAG